MSTKAKGFVDGLKNVFNGLANRRSAQSQNVPVDSGRLSDATLRTLYKSGIVNKIIRLKEGPALNDTLQFSQQNDREFYDRRLAAHVKDAVKYMLGFGRGVIVVFMPGDDLAAPLGRIDPESVKVRTFSGDMVSSVGAVLDLQDDRYYKPAAYSVRGQIFHHSRVFDFTYVKPSEFNAPEYRYGGMPEPELIYPQLINDGVIERASATMLEKASSFIYKVTGFKDSMRAKKDKEVIEYFGRVEDMRSIYGAVLLDSEDEASAVNQQLTGLADTNMISLQRLAMVTGIPLPWLVGENVKGMNAVGENERQIYQDMIEALESDYIAPVLFPMLRAFGIDGVEFKENQGETPTARIQYDSTAIDNALKLWQMGEDHSKYLEDRGVVESDPWAEFFAEGGDDTPSDDELLARQQAAEQSSGEEADQ